MGFSIRLHLKAAQIGLWVLMMEPVITQAS